MCEALAVAMPLIGCCISIVFPELAFEKKADLKEATQTLFVIRHCKHSRISKISYHNLNVTLESKFIIRLKRTVDSISKDVYILSSLNTNFMPIHIFSSVCCITATFASRKKHKQQICIRKAIYVRMTITSISASTRTNDITLWPQRYDIDHTGL